MDALPAPPLQSRLESARSAELLARSRLTRVQFDQTAQDVPFASAIVSIVYPEQIWQSGKSERLAGYGFRGGVLWKNPTGSAFQGEHPRRVRKFVECRISNLFSIACQDDSLVCNLLLMRAQQRVLRKKGAFSTDFSTDVVWPQTWSVWASASR
jgi:hypothetical protein